MRSCTGRAGAFRRVTCAFPARPQGRCADVFEPGVQGSHRTFGHVAWVESVKRRSDGWYLTVSEMNFPVAGRITSRTVKYVRGMSYIWAP